jgi:hypothetical protein
MLLSAEGGNEWRMGGVCTKHTTLRHPLLHPTSFADRVPSSRTDSSGKYDVQHADRPGPDGRCIMKSDSEGIFWFKAIVPVPYPIPHDGPVGQLLKTLGRHPMRPSHMHFMFEKEGFDHLITCVSPTSHVPGQTAWQGIKGKVI